MFDYSLLASQFEKTAKKAITGSEDINMKAEAQTGFLLATAAFCSGTGWQPIVNTLQGMNLPFASVFAGT